MIQWHVLYRLHKMFQTADCTSSCVILYLFKLLCNFKQNRKQSFPIEVVHTAVSILAKSVPTFTLHTYYLKQTLQFSSFSFPLVSQSYLPLRSHLRTSESFPYLQTRRCYWNRVWKTSCEKRQLCVLLRRQFYLSAITLLLFFFQLEQHFAVKGFTEMFCFPQTNLAIVHEFVCSWNRDVEYVLLTQVAYLSMTGILPVERHFWVRGIRGTDT